jgi:hypothetical protein
MTNITNFYRKHKAKIIIVIISFGLVLFAYSTYNQATNWETTTISKYELQHSDSYEEVLLKTTKRHMTFRNKQTGIEYHVSKRMFFSNDKEIFAKVQK